MIRSLRTGVTGLKTHQARMDVVGNNIANVNTVAFKRSNAVFSEVLGQQILGLSRTSGAAGVTAGVVGYGAAIGAVKQNWGQGALEFSNVNTDLAIDGDGFFLARNGERQLLTRAGSYTFDQDGVLVTNGGLAVQAFEMDDAGAADTSRLVDVTLDGTIQAAPKFSELLKLGGNIPSRGDEVVSVTSGVYDEQGSKHLVEMSFTPGAAANEWDYNVQYGGTLTPPPFAAVTGTISFGTDGLLVDDSPISLTWDAGYVTGAPAFDVDIAGLTQFGSGEGVVVRSADGYGSGNLAGYSIDGEGVFWLNFTNGQQKAAYQFALATVNNPHALENLGENLYGLTPASGDLITGRAGAEISSAVISGALEASNVDLATEFTDMIVAQRGYQASARVITTSDELLQEVVSLKR